jgi:transposase
VIVGEHLKDFQGSLITDGLAVYATYCEARRGISHGGCWAHARRKFTDAIKVKKGQSGIALEAIDLIKELFKIEADAKEAKLTRP